MRVAIMGFGEIGSALYELSRRAGNDTTIHDPYKGYCARSDGALDVLEVCIPFYEGFVADVSRLVTRLDPRMVIIESSVAHVTIEELLRMTTVPMVHSPVRGSHSDMERALKRVVKFVGPARGDTKIAEEYYRTMGIKTKVLKSYRETTVGKLLQTTWYAMQIAFANYAYKVCDRHHVNFDDAYKEFQRTAEIGREYTEGEPTENPERIRRPVMYPGSYGGKCLRPNIDLLGRYYDHTLPDYLYAEER